MTNFEIGFYKNYKTRFQSRTRFQSTPRNRFRSGSKTTPPIATPNDPQTHHHYSIKTFVSGYSPNPHKSGVYLSKKSGFILLREGGYKSDPSAIERVWEKKALSPGRGWGRVGEGGSRDTISVETQFMIFIKIYNSVYKIDRNIKLKFL